VTVGQRREAVTVGRRGDRWPVRSGTAGRVVPALVPPVLAKLVVVEPAQLVRVMIQPVGGSLHLVEVLPVIAGRRLLLASLAHDMQLFLAQLHDLGQCFFQIHRVPFPGHGLAC